MRNFGGVLLLVGFVGFLFCSDRLSKLEPVPPGQSVSESVRFYPAGRWEVARYVAAAAAGFGLLMAVFPKGR